MHKQAGQTLIETMVAVFVLVMGITAALGLASYSLNASTSIRKQIIGMGLAREGIEAVKNMRDTNWLRDPLSTSCYNFATGSNDAGCYPNWLNATADGGYDIDPDGSAQTYVLWFNAEELESGPYWYLQPENTRFGLNLQMSPEFAGLYTHMDGLVTSTNATSDFSRKITIIPESRDMPFNQQTGPRLRVLVQVWWKDKSCPVSNDVPSNKKCSIALETYLTNWKTYTYGE